jgi:hydroxymethylbilane synthase
LRLGTRASPLAVAQAHEVRARLCAAHGWDEASITIVPVTASADRIRGPLADVGGKALWTKELDGWLHEREIDFAVHSLKDVETIRPDVLAMAAILPREDVRDCLVGAASVEALPQGARLGTSAPRRAAQMLHLRPDLRIVPFRGNVATRLVKLEAGEADATLLAMAGLNRLGHKDVGTPLDEQTFLPASGQGAIAVECRSDDAATIALLAAIDHAPSRHAVLAERAAGRAGRQLPQRSGRADPPRRRADPHDRRFVQPRWRRAIAGEVHSPPATMMASPRWPATCWPARLPKSPSISTEPEFVDRAAADPAPSARQCGQLCRRRTAGRGAGGGPSLRDRTHGMAAPDPTEIDALLIGSANALRHAGPHLAAYAGKPAYMVGEATAQAARQAGLHVEAVGSGGLQTVLDQVAPNHSRLLRLAGYERVVLTVPPHATMIERTVYAAVPRPLPRAVARLMLTHALPGVVAALHSAQAALHLAQEIDRLGLPRARLHLATIGPRVTAAAGMAGARSTRRPGPMIAACWRWPRNCATLPRCVWGIKSFDRRISKSADRIGDWRSLAGRRPTRAAPPLVVADPDHAGRFRRRSRGHGRGRPSGLAGALRHRPVELHPAAGDPAHPAPALLRRPCPDAGRHGNARRRAGAEARQARP